MTKSLLSKLTAAREATVWGRKTKRTKPIIGSKEFFIENDPTKGIASKHNFGEYVEALNEEELAELDKFFKYLTEKKRLDFGRGIRFDQQGRPYYWVSVQTGRITRGFKLLDFDGLDRLIEVNGQYEFDLALEHIFDQLEELPQG
ncbi:MAG TPA: hypothetical protein VNQ80_07690 [Parapedobacter sp.]|uniref:hypothetical protein n=1 Tax=Parapedobacter sp. TaxID=1958893 RepID=UPI002BE5AB44|nr:hypothetical protein [Parapedobacter sp.]HWK57202.1 hypothetical protein [Parapedobacter sp.]